MFSNPRSLNLLILFFSVAALGCIGFLFYSDWKEGNEKEKIQLITQQLEQEKLQRRRDDAEESLKFYQYEQEKIRQKQELEKLIDERVRDRLNTSRCNVVGQTISCY